MELEKQVVNLKLSKKLKELGVKQGSYWNWCYPNDQSQWYITTHFTPRCYSAYTCAELGEMLPEEDWFYKKNITNDNNSEWWIAKKNKYDLQIAITEANARAKMLIWLIENKYIEVK